MVVRLRSEAGFRAKLVLLASLVLLAVIAGLMALVGGTDGAEAGAIDQPTREALAIFREARADDDEMPGNPQRDLELAHDIQPGENVGLSRRVAHPGGDAFVWPMTGGVCHSSPAGSGCVPTSVIANRGVDVGVRARLDLGSRTYEDVRVFGIARDGIDEIRLRLLNGSEVTATVRENTFLALGLADKPASVSWTDEDGNHTVAVPGQTAAALAEEIAGP